MAVTLAIVLSATISSIVAFFMAIGSPLAIERLGGIIGGVIASLPSLIIPGSVAMVLSGATDKEVFEGMMSFPAGMFVNACLLIVWRLISAKVPKDWSVLKKLLVHLVIVFIIWLIAASVVAFVISKTLKVPPVWVGSVSIVLHFTIGMVNLILTSSNAPRGKNKVTWKTHLLRGSTASVIIFIAVFVAKINPTISGLIISFPAIIMTTVGSLYIAQGEEVTTGATAPMMLASVSSDTYAIMFAVVLPKVGPVGTPFVSFFVALIGISIPLAFFMRYLSNRRGQKDVEYTKLQAVGTDMEVYNTQVTVYGETENTQSESSELSIMRSTS